MDKKELKFYEAPACEVVGLNASVALLVGSVASDGGQTGPGNTPDPDDMEEL